MERRANKPLIGSRFRFKTLYTIENPPLPGQSNFPEPGPTLPMQLTSFIGRRSEIDAVCGLLGKPVVRLVNLTGTGGTGKTRLSLAVAEKLQHEFEDGVYFVNLAPVSNPEAGLSAIARTLDLQDNKRRSPLEKLQNFFQKREILLILDNLEHLLDLGQAISELLLTAPRLKVLVTSRSILHFYGENVFSVPALNIAELTEEAPFETVSRNEAVQLFGQTAKMINRTFKLNPDNYRLVAAICRYLEGLPLSIELAAARSDVFPLQSQLDRLVAGNRFEFLQSGFRNLSERQRTLYASIEWSYQLLSEPEKRLFRKLGVFVGSCSLTAAGTLDGNSDATVTLGTIEALFNKSLLKPVETVPDEDLRFTMLETVREFALAKLAEAGELEETWDIYCNLFIELVESSTTHLQTPNQSDWIKCLQANHANILNVLDHLIETGDVKRAYHLGAFIWVAWCRWGYLNEGRQWLNKLLNLDRSQVDIEIQAHLLAGVGYLANQQADNHFAQIYFEEALAIWRSKGPSPHLAEALSALANNERSLGNFSQAIELSYESLKLFRDLGEKALEANVLCNIGWQLMDRGKYETVRALIEESIALHTEAKNLFGVARTKICLSEFLWRQGQTSQAIEMLEESIRFLRTDNRTIWLSCALSRLGLIFLCVNQYDMAERLLEEALEKNLEMDKQRDLIFDYSTLGLLKLVQNDLNQAETLFQAGVNNSANIVGFEGITWLKEGLAVLAIEKGNLDEAKELLNQAGQMHQEFEIPFLPHTLKFIVPVLEKNDLLTGVYRPFSAKKQPDRSEISSATDTISAKSRQVSPTSYPYPYGELSRRESEVLRLVAQGHQTSQIAEILVISAGTVNNHLNSIYSKLGVNSRTRAVRYALDNGML